MVKGETAPFRAFRRAFGKISSRRRPAFPERRRKAFNVKRINRQGSASPSSSGAFFFVIPKPTNDRADGAAERFRKVGDFESAFLFGSYERRDLAKRPQELRDKNQRRRIFPPSFHRTASLFPLTRSLRFPPFFRPRPRRSPRRQTTITAYRFRSKPRPRRRPSDVRRPKSPNARNARINGVSNALTPLPPLL